VISARYAQSHTDGEYANIGDVLSVAERVYLCCADQFKNSVDALSFYFQESTILQKVGISNLWLNIYPTNSLMMNIKNLLNTIRNTPHSLKTVF
jgi:hypothetical protein